MMLLVASETLEENSELGNEMSVSVEPSLGGILWLLRNL